MKRHFICLSALIVLCLLGASVIGAEEACANPCGLSKDLILAYPEPNVEQLVVNSKLLHDRRYQQVKDRIDIYNMPDGEIIGSLDAGFNFLTVFTPQDNGWTEINSGQWVKSEFLKDSNGIISQFSGVKLPEKPLPYTMAWVLVNLYPSKTPGGNPSESNPLVWRYSRVNIYFSIEIDGEVWYQIGVDKWVHQYHVAKILPLDRPAEVTTGRWISIDLYEQVVIAYEDHTPVFATLISSGLPRWPTNEGVFNIYFRTPRKQMRGGVVGDDFYFLEEVPWTMFFDEGRALHGAYWHDGFGYRRSHGCVNLSITDAHWLYHWVAEEMGSKISVDVEEGPIVYVYSSGTYK